MEPDIFQTDLQTVDLFAYYLKNEVGTDRSGSLQTTAEQDIMLRKLEPAVVVMVEKAKADQSNEFQALSDDYDGWRASRITLNYFLTTHRDLLLYRLPEFRAYYVSEAKRITFEKKLSDMTGGEFNVYLQIIGIIKP